jgi:hypothetical protein
VKSSKAKKAKKSPLFVMSVDNLFKVSPTRVSFCVHGKPMPQQRDRFGWNGTRYNPSKPSQEAFAKVVNEFFQCHGEVFHFANATIDVKDFFFFPTLNNKSRIQPMWTIFVSFSLIASMVFYIMMMAKLYDL